MKAKIEDLAPPSNAEMHLRKQIEGLMHEKVRLQEQIGERDEFARQCAAAIVASRPFPRFRYTRAKKIGKPMVAGLDLSDWHIGEVVQENEVEGFNKFNWAVAQERIFGIVTDFLKWVEVQRYAYLIEEVRIIGKGDYISGDIHKELQVTNEFPIPEQSVKAGLLLGEVIRRIAPHFKRVGVEAVGADNHGRLNPKPQAKQKTSNNMSFIVHAMAVSDTARCNNVVWSVAKGMKHLAEINGFRFLIEHGDSIKGWAGLPFYGFQRLVGREAVRRMNTNRGFHYLSIGHFHVPTWLEARTIVNGSLSGTSEFDHSQGRHAKPSQVAYLVHPEHGMFNVTAFLGSVNVPLG